LIILSYLAVFALNWIFASLTKINFNPFKWYFNDIRDYMGVQSIFGLFLQLNWKETFFVTSWKNIYAKTSFNIPLSFLVEYIYLNLFGQLFTPSFNSTTYITKTQVRLIQSWSWIITPTLEQVNHKNVTFFRI
jgi:hypothetical protein